MQVGPGSVVTVLDRKSVSATVKLCTQFWSLEALRKACLVDMPPRCFCDSLRCGGYGTFCYGIS